MTTTLPEQDVAAPDIVLDEVAPYEDNDDGGDHFTHIINPEMNQEIQAEFGRMETPQEIVNTARAVGYEVTALCGFKFIPKRNPEKYPSCQACFDIAGLIIESGAE